MHFADLQYIKVYPEQRIHFFATQKWQEFTPCCCAGNAYCIKPFLCLFTLGHGLSLYCHPGLPVNLIDDFRLPIYPAWEKVIDFNNGVKGQIDSGATFQVFNITEVNFVLVGCVFGIIPLR